MKKIIKKSKGITLIALIITVIMLIILASITVYSGKSVIKSSKFTAFTAEMKIMQAQVNELYEKYKNGETIQVGSETYTGEQILNMRKDSTEENYSTNIENIEFPSYTQAEKVFTAEESGVTNKEGYLYFNQKLIEDLNIEGVKEEFFVNIGKRSVISYYGFDDGEYKYYTIEQIPKSLYNVEYNDKNTEKPEFDINVENIAISKWRITISNVNYSNGYIEKWYVKYRCSENDEEGIKEEEKKWNTSEDLSFIVNEEGNYEIYLQDQSGNIKSDKIEQYVDGWKEVSQQEWSYDYGSNKINPPKLIGNMKPINYVGELQTGNKWANAKTADGSMWVWIPRYAYRITEGYHSNESGTIEVAFLDIENNFINNDSKNIELIELGLTDADGKQWSIEDLTYTNNVQQQWIVHPAFTGYPEYGGWSEELDGIWVGKFEATGTYDSTSETGTLSVKPGQASLCSMTINQQYKLAKSSTFGETKSINSHMAKNSEWGATVYLGHSKYGTNAQKVENNNVGYIAGGSSIPSTIYKRNVTQSTTHNATGVYDMNGGAWDRTASYVYISSSSNLQTNGGTESGDIYGADTKEQSESTAYKTVYESVNNQSTDYATAKKYKGDAVYETSNSQSNSTGSWFAASAYFPSSGPFFTRSGGSGYSYAVTFCFSASNGNASNSGSFRPVLAF